KLVVTGGAGQITATASDGGLDFIGGKGTATLSLGNGFGNIRFGAGNTTVVENLSNPWRGGNLFSFAAGTGGGNDLIKGFQVGVDHIALHGVTVTSQAIAGGSAQIVLSDHTHLTLAGVGSLNGIFS
ncbi:MAG TPA: hypothetical protein VGC80_04835, partial [Acetobacteraceae bacterium]